ncbi:MAG TPA: sugar ABC transporter permease, partial [Micromonosporaceae bacterium]|nr:sugar ABC transporter permease [Micromonosporaceae bacterium]
MTRRGPATRRAVERGPARWLRRVGWRHGVAWLAVAFSLFPILFVLSAALNPLGTLSSTEVVPTAVTGDNFADLFSRTPFEMWYLNSILIAGVSAFAAVGLSILAAYAFSRMRFAGRRVGLLSLL